MVKGDDIYIENYHFEQVKEKFKEMGVIWKADI
jgi:hypothetical protein